MSHKTHVHCRINGEPAEFLCEPRQSLLEVLRDEARVDSYRWGPTIMWIVLAVILVVIAVAGLVWLL